MWRCVGSEMTASVGRRLARRLRLRRVGLRQFGLRRFGLRRFGLRRFRLRQFGLALLVGVFATVGVTACGGDDEQRVAPYDVTPVPAVPDRTAAPTDGALPDGQYWTTALLPGATEGTLAATIVQAYFGPGCIEALGEAACTPEPGVAAEPTVDLAIDPAGVVLVTVVDADRRNYSIPVAELVRLVAGEAPNPLAPEGYEFSDDPFLLTVRNGAVTGINQIWVG